LIGGENAFFSGRGIGLRGRDSRFLRGNIGLRLDVLNPGDHLILANVIAFLHQKIDDPALRVSADIDVRSGLNFARRGDNRGQIHTRSCAGLDRYEVPLAPLHASVYPATDQSQCEYRQRYLPLTFHVWGSPTS
jgi:hypothetical protein